MKGYSLPTLRLARELSKARGLDGLILVGFANGNVGIASYGASKAQCSDLASLVDYISLAIERGEMPLESLDNGIEPLTIRE